MRKYRLLFVPSDQAGCGLYRTVMPANKLGDYPDLDVIIHYDPQVSDVDTADMLIVQRMRLTDQGGSMVDRNRPLVDHALHRGIPVVYETDDYDKALPKDHGLYTMYKRDKVYDRVLWMLNNATAITTTTPYLAARLQESTPRPVHVFPNCLNFNDPMWRHYHISCSRTRIGWAGGSSHLADIKLFTAVAETLHQRYGDKIDFLLGGYDTRGVYSYYDENGVRHDRPAEEHESVWVEIRKAYFGDIPSTSHRVMNTLPINVYGWHYSQFDIGVIPLVDHEFNRCKSPLKLLEFGAYSVPVVASDVEPYKALKAFDPESLINTSGRYRDTLNGWVKALSLLIDDPVERNVRGTRLNRYIREHYDILKVVEDRRRFIMELLNC